MQNIVKMLRMASETVRLLSREQDRLAAEHVLALCRQWLRDRSVSGSTLLDLLDNEESGITLKEEAAENEAEQAVWNCIIDAAAYTARLAYEAEQCPFLPEPLELADASILPHFEACYLTCFPEGE